MPLVRYDPWPSIPVYCMSVSIYDDEIGNGVGSHEILYKRVVHDTKNRAFLVDQT